MTTLLCFDFLGILLSFLVQIYVLLGFSLPSGQIAVMLNLGIGIVFCMRLFMTKKLRQGNEWFFEKGLINTCPLWLKLVMSLTIIYGSIIGIFFLSRFFSEFSLVMQDSTGVSRKLYIGLFSLLMICYAIEYLVLYLMRERSRNRCSF